MIKQEIKTIVKDVINENVNPKFEKIISDMQNMKFGLEEFIESIMSRQYGMFKEQFVIRNS